MRILPALKKEFPDFSNIHITQASRDMADPTSFVYEILRDTYDYNPETEEIRNPPDGMTDGSGNTRGHDIKVFLVGVYAVDVDEDGEDDVGKIGLNLLSDNAQFSVQVIVDVEGFKPEKSYLHVSFSHSESTRDVLWTYELGSGVYPDLEDSDLNTKETGYYPVVPLRVSGRDMTDESARTQQLYKTSKQLLRRVNLNILELAETIRSNDNIEYIDFVHFGMKVDIRDDSSAVTEYLGRYFYSLYQDNGDSKTVFDAWGAGGKKRTPPITTIIIQDGTWKQTLGYSYIEVKEEDGILTEPTVEFGLKERDEIRGDGDRPTYEYERSGVTYSYQYAAGKIRTVHVVGLMSVEHIYNKSTTIDINLQDSTDELTKLMIPIHKDVVRSMRLVDRNELYHSSMYLSIVSYHEEREKWYASAAFKLIVAIISLAVGAGPGGGYAAAYLGISIAAVQVVVNILINMIIGILIGVLARVTARILIDMFGPEWAKWITAALVVVSIYLGYGSDNPELYSYLAMGFTETFGEVIDNIISDIKEEIEEFREETEALKDKLDKIMEELLGDQLVFDVASVLTEARRVQPLYLAQESGAQYYSRIEGSRHMNEILLSIPSVYNTNTLTLPTLDEAINTFKKA